MSEGHFAKEAIDELVGLLTHPKFKQKLIVILAGYDKDMVDLMRVNSGLASRFPTQISFQHMGPSECIQVLDRDLRKNDIVLPALSDPTSAPYSEMADVIAALSRLPTWGNARDMLTLSKEMIAVAMLSDTGTASQVILSSEDAIKCMKTMLSDQWERSIPKTSIISRQSELVPQQAAPGPAPSLAPSQTASTTVVAEAPPVERLSKGSKEAYSLSAHSTEQRDAGVSDQTWNRLQACKKAEQEKEKKVREELERLEEDKRVREKYLGEQRARAKALAETVARNERHRLEIKRQQEEVRLKELAAREAQRVAAAALDAKRKQEEARKAKEAAVQAALRRMGVCVAGFQWINVGFGYRCAGGSHFVSNDQLP